MASNQLTFRLNKGFLLWVEGLTNPYKGNPLGELVYKRTYSRLKENGDNETWKETVQRVVEGTYSVMKEHIKTIGKTWNEAKAQRSAQEMYELMFNMYFLPPGRGLWAMGTDLIHTKGLGLALNNCAFISTKNILDDPIYPFATLMDMSMCGVGTGLDTKGANKVRIYKPEIPANQLGINHHTITDSREGWVSSVEDLLRGYFNPGLNITQFDYSEIREKGARLKTFGGVSSGPDPLIKLHGEIEKTFDREFERQKDSSEPKLSSTGIVDICNLIGVCVVSGNIRRTAEIMFGEDDDEEFLDLKNYKKNAHRAVFGWTSNNSVFANEKTDYFKLQERIKDNGEPGIAWLDRMRSHSRMCDPPDWKDRRVDGGNPCLEQSLESDEVCCLVETFPARHQTKEKFLRTLKYAFLYAKVVTLVPTHIPKTNDVISANRRIGSSLSGIAQFLGKNNIDTFRIWCEEAYSTTKKWDNIYSKWFEIPESIKITSIKPSGSVSLLASSTPGVHYPNSRYYKRRVRMSTGSPLIEELKKSGYHVEPDAVQPEHTQIVEFPIDIGKCKTLDDVTMYHQLEMAAFLQHYYADNQVSCTVTFRPDEGNHIAEALETYQYRLKGISFLPRCDNNYPQMPYEKLLKEQYEKEVKNVRERASGFSGEPDTKRQRVEDPDATAFCDGETCTLNL